MGRLHGGAVQWVWLRLRLRLVLLMLVTTVSGSNSISRHAAAVAFGIQHVDRIPSKHLQDLPVSSLVQVVGLAQQLVSTHFIQDQGSPPTVSPAI